MKLSRTWAMPTGDTFDCKPIGQFVNRWIKYAKISIDPFARNKNIATYTNDLNPETKAEYHLDALDFLLKMENDGVRPDFVIFDPPYSPRQIKELYDGIGIKMQQHDSWKTNGWTKERDVVNRITPSNSICLTFGWNSTGMGKKRGWEIKEIMLVCHGGGHNDTICMAEQKMMGDIFNE